MGSGGNDAVDESKITLCCAVCCLNCGTYEAVDCLGCSGKMGVCCLNGEVCCKPGAPMLPCICCGPRCEFDGCSVFNAQLQCMNFVITGALPCNKEVPVAVTILGLTLFPKVGCCVSIGEIRGGSSDYVNSDEMQR